MNSEVNKIPTCVKVVFLTPVIGTVILVSVLITNTIVISQNKYSWDEVKPLNSEVKWILDQERVLERGLRLAEALKIKTISWEENKQEKEEFHKLHEHIRNSFPLIHSSPSVEYTIINQYSLLYKIRGPESSSVEPFMLAAHLDVVPVNGTWTAEPFDGKIIDRVIYGRGALDDKSSVMGILEALEFLLEGGYQFQRTFYVAFGHDEEISGFDGAGEICKHLKANGVEKLDFVLDEGYFVLEDLVKGVDDLVSVIGVTEKGYATLELSVVGNPGHSSMPPRETPIGILARAVSLLEENPQPSVFGQGPELDFFTYIAPHANLGYRFIFSNMWLFTPLMKNILGKDPTTDAIQRTTTAVTIFQAGYKSNVLPGSATAVVNHRIHPADSLDDVLERHKRLIGDPRVKIKVRSNYPPTPISPYGEEAPAFELIARTVKQIYPSSTIAPACSPANTDLRRYVDLTNNLYRINPTILTPNTRGGIHGDDERISIDHFHNFIQFYIRLVINADLSATEHLKANRFHREL